MNAPAKIDLNLPRFASVEELIAREQPDTPVYVLHPEKYHAAAKRFLDAFPGDTLYAIKANPAPHVLDLVYASGIRHFDTASVPEVEYVHSRFPDAHCHFMAPVRSPGAAKLTFEKHGVTDFVVDCDFELDKLLSEVKDAKKLRIFVRIATPLGGAMLELSSKFGTTPADAARLLKRVAGSGAQPAITFHVGSQCLSPFSYAQAIEMARRTSLMAGVTIVALDLGGGFPVTYPGNDVPPYHWYFDTIKEALMTMGQPDLPILCEPGRALIAEGLSVVTQVILRKGDKLYINDGIYGSFDELAITGWTADYPLRAFSLEKGKAVSRPIGQAPFRIYGPTCDTLDVLPRPLMLHENVKAGDYIVFDAMGAYSVALRTNFNGFYPDKWVIVGN